MDAYSSKELLWNRFGLHVGHMYVRWHVFKQLIVAPLKSVCACRGTFISECHAGKQHYAQPQPQEIVHRISQAMEHSASAIEQKIAKSVSDTAEENESSHTGCKQTWSKSSSLMLD